MGAEEHAGMLGSSYRVDTMKLAIQVKKRYKS